MAIQIRTLINGKDQFLVAIVLVVENFKIFGRKLVLTQCDYLRRILNHLIHICCLEIKSLSIGIAINCSI